MQKHAEFWLSDLRMATDSFLLPLPKETTNYCLLLVAEKLCDKVAIIKQGRLIKSGTMEDVRGDESLEEVFLELEAE